MHDQCLSTFFVGEEFTESLDFGGLVTLLLLSLVINTHASLLYSIFARNDSLAAENM